MEKTRSRGKAAEGKAVERKAAEGKAAERLPSTRPELLALHRELRHRRDAAPIGSHERAAAMAEIGRVEVEIARIERAMDPPLV